MSSKPGRGRIPASKRVRLEALADSGNTAVDEVDPSSSLFVQDDENRLGLVLFLLGSHGYVEQADRCANVSTILRADSRVAEGIARHTIGRSKKTRLQYAAMTGRVDRLKWLCERGYPLHNVGDCFNRTPLYFAASENRMECVQLLLQQGANPNESLRGTQNAGSTPLFKACSRGYHDVVALLLEHGADPDASILIDGTTPSIAAAEAGHMAVLALLLSRGVNLEAKNKKGCTALYRAVSAGHEDAARLLLDRGAVATCRNGEGYTPLHTAIGQPHEGLVKLLLSRGANVEAQNNNGTTPLFRAAHFGHAEIVRILLDHGADANAQRGGPGGMTALMGACYEKKINCATLLIQRGADVST